MGDSQKMRLVNWSQLCSPIQNGGLGVKNLCRFNQVLLGKWLWRYGMKRVAYGNMWGGWCIGAVRGSYASAKIGIVSCLLYPI